MSIQVSPERLREEKAKHLTLAHDVQSIRQTLINRSYGLNWGGSGGSHEEFLKLLHRMNAFADELATCFEELGGVLEEAAQTFEDTDKTIGSKIQGLDAPK